MKNRFILSILFTFLLISLPNNSEASTNPSLTSSSVITTDKTKSTEQTVREYFSDIPVMIEIARCESKFRQFTDSGNVLHGGYGGQMVGIFQFYKSVHEDSALALGFDINTVKGNLAYARHIYEQQNTTPWNSSSHCWGNVELPSPKKVKQTTVQNTTKSDLLKQIVQLKQVLELLKQLQTLTA